MTIFWFLIFLAAAGFVLLVHQRLEYYRRNRFLDFIAWGLGLGYMITILATLAVNQVTPLYLKTNHFGEGPAEIALTVAAIIFVAWRMFQQEKESVTTTTASCSSTTTFLRDIGEESAQSRQ